MYDYNDQARWKVAASTKVWADLGPKGGPVWAEYDPGIGTLPDDLARQIIQVGGVIKSVWVKTNAALQSDRDMELSPRAADVRASTDGTLVVFFWVTARYPMTEDRFHALVETLGNAGVDGWNRKFPKFRF